MGVEGAIADSVLNLLKNVSIHLAALEGKADTLFQSRPIPSFSSNQPLAEFPSASSPAFDLAVPATSTAYLEQSAGAFGSLQTLHSPAKAWLAAVCGQGLGRHILQPLWARATTH